MRRELRRKPHSPRLYTIHFTPYTAPLAPIPPLCVNSSFFSLPLTSHLSPLTSSANRPQRLAAAPTPLFLHSKRAALPSTAVAKPTRWSTVLSTSWTPYRGVLCLPTTGGPTPSSTLGQANYGHTPHSYGQMPQAYPLPNPPTGNPLAVR